MGRNILHLLMVKRAMRQGRPLALALCATLAFCACDQPVPPAQAFGQSTTAASPVLMPASDVLSAWIAYWDLTRGMAEWRAHPGLFSSVRVFAASFDQNDQAFLAPQWAALLDKGAASVFGGTPAFLTVVNDLITPSGKGVKAKDPELVRRLVSGPGARATHIDALIALAKRYKFSGLEIDYEDVSESVWPEFLTFVSELYQRTQREGLALSVLLQPQRRYLGTRLPAGPAYVLMGYDLFGFHSGPGPKATPAFLAEQADSLRAIGALDSTALALATGGFDWTGPKHAQQLGEVEATTLLARKKAVSERSAADGYLVSHYRDGRGQAHEVWHADAKTLATLWQAAHTAGFSRLVIWRLGGNSPALFDWLATLEH